jgi:UPF0042 nucleotide-binding protein
MKRTHSLVVVTGLSGAGKSTAAKVMEDMGYYTIDNMPIAILEQLVGVLFDLQINTSKLAFVIDARSKDAAGALRVISALQRKYEGKVLFLTANEDALINRFKENRRKHPLGEDIMQAIRAEEGLLTDIKATADLVVDTSFLNVHELTREIKDFFKEREEALSVMLNSFGFKYGLPVDSDMVFDVRFMRNPHFDINLRDKTGLDRQVSDYVFESESSCIFMEKLKDMTAFLIPEYIREGKNFLKISVGCTGGKHRSVAVIMKLADYVNNISGIQLQLRHRDIER